MTMQFYATRAARDLAETRARSEKTRSGKVSCLGPDGSFSALAAQELCKGYEPIFCENFAEVAARLTSGEADYAVLPVENSLNGGVLPVLDVITQADIFGEEEYLCFIDHRLAMREGTKEEDITTICSHEQALGQCTEFLHAHFPHATQVSVSSTAESLERLDGHTAGIVGAHIVREGVTLSKENIADNKQNFTRFLRFSRRDAVEVHGSAMVFCCAVCPHRPGALLGLLKIFQRYSLNLTRIESRPMKDAFGEYRFFVEFAGNISDERVKTALKEANGYCRQFKLLGAYH